MFVFRYRIDLTFSQKKYEKIVRVVIDIKDSIVLHSLESSDGLTMCLRPIITETGSFTHYSKTENTYQYYVPFLW